MPDKIILWEDGSWEWLNDAQEKDLKFITLTLGHGWSNSEVSRMVADFYEDQLGWIFDKEEIV